MTITPPVALRHTAPRRCHAGLRCVDGFDRMPARRGALRSCSLRRMPSRITTWLLSAVVRSPAGPACTRRRRRSPAGPARQHAHDGFGDVARAAGADFVGGDHAHAEGSDSPVPRSASRSRVFRPAPGLRTGSGGGERGSGCQQAGLRAQGMHVGDHGSKDDALGPRRLPRRRTGRHGHARRTHAATSLAGIRAGGRTPIAFPGPLIHAAPSGIDDGSGASRRRRTGPGTAAPVARCTSAYRCGGSAGWIAAATHGHARGTPPAPLNCGMRTTPETSLDSKVLREQKPYNSRMASGSPIDPLVERVERLLVRYEELQRTNALLAEQVELLTTERDSLKSRLSAARSRVDALLERLPDLNTPA